MQKILKINQKKESGDKAETKLMAEKAIFRFLDRKKAALKLILVILSISSCCFKNLSALDLLLEQNESAEQ